MCSHRVWTRLVLALATSPAPALAQTAPVQPSGTVKDAASTDEKALLAEAAKLYHEGKWAEAEVMFRRAFEVNPAYTTAGNLALCQQQLGRPREAAEHLSFALRQWPAGEKAASRDLAVKTLAELTAAVGTLTVKVNAPGARVVVNGREVGRSPLLDPVFVEPGKATLSAFKEGHATVKVEVEVTAGQELPVTLTLEPPPPPPPTASVTATAPPPPPPRSKVPAFVIGGVGVASLIVGGVLVGVGEAMGAEVINDAPRGTDGQLLCRKTPTPATTATTACDDWRAKAAESATLGNAGVGFFVVAGLAAAGTATYLLWPSGSRPSAASHWVVAPVVGLRGGGAVLQGRF